MSVAGPAVEAALRRIAEADGTTNAFTAVWAERARSDAESVDVALRRGEERPLAGVTFAAKALFDVEGEVTRAGSRVWDDRPPAERDATAVARLRAAGAVLLGATNMDEFASGFTTENARHGPTRNPHDPSRIAGGSSGGSAAAVAAGMVPVALASDTNGSIRVPSALCGVWGLKPTYGRLSRAGCALFAESFDHVGPIAATLDDLVAAYDAMQGHDPRDPAQAPRPVEPLTGAGGRPRVAVAEGPHFDLCDEEGLSLAAEAGALLGAGAPIRLPEAGAGWSAAVAITLIEGASAHVDDLRRHAEAFDPMTRDRFLAGLMVPAEAYLVAQRARRAWRDRCLDAMEASGAEVIVTPATPFAAPPIGTDRVEVAGRIVDPRAALGHFTQPFSAIGLPALAVPIATRTGLPRAVQLVAAPWREDDLAAAARILEGVGFARAHIRSSP